MYIRLTPLLILVFFAFVVLAICMFGFGAISPEGSFPDYLAGICVGIVLTCGLCIALRREDNNAH
jgi:hypothetical protein